MFQSHLQNPLGQAGLLRELLEVLGVRVVVDGEVRLHGAQLVVLEARAHALGALVVAAVGASHARRARPERHVQVGLGVQVCNSTV